MLLKVVDERRGEKAAGRKALKRPAAALGAGDGEADTPDAPAKLFGCGKCRGSPSGCASCRSPNFGGKIWQRE